MPLATLRRGPFRASILSDRFYGNSLFHYVVQRKGARDVLAWGQERTLAAARHAAERQMDLLMESEPLAKRTSA